MLKNNKKINKKAFSFSDQMFFAQRLSLLLGSGIAIVPALSMMQNMDSGVDRRFIYTKLINNIEQGMSLSKSIKILELRFNSLLMTLIQNGEALGHLSEALVQAHKYLEKKDDMKKKLISSLMYPFFIICATVGMTLFLVLYIFPKIIPLLTSLDIELPLITRIVQGFYYFSISYGLYTLALLALLVIVFTYSTHHFKSLRYRVHLLLLTLPFIGTHMKTYLMASVCSIGEMFLLSGRGSPDMLVFSMETSKNEVYKKAFGDIHAESVQGIALSVSLKKQGRLFPLLLPDMCSLGERTGNLSAMLGHCSRIFEQDIDNLLKRFSALVEPILMVFMGLVVGSVALSIILPVYEITNHLTK